MMSPHKHRRITYNDAYKKLKISCKIYFLPFCSLGALNCQLKHIVFGSIVEVLSNVLKKRAKLDEKKTVSIASTLKFPYFHAFASMSIPL